MRILFISDLLSYGGASKLIYDLLPIMKAKGNYCELLILTDKNSKYIDELSACGIKVTVVPKEYNTHSRRIKYIKHFITKGNFDVVHAHLFPTIYYCSVIKRMLGKKCPPLIMTEHNTDNRRRHKPILRPLERFMYSPYNCVISISDKTQENLCNWLKVKDKRKFKVIENGINISQFREAKPLEKTDLFPNYKEGDILLLTVGRFEKQKNHEGLIKAFAKLPENYILLLCGEGSLESTIKELAQKMNVIERVAFLGFRLDVARIMHTADIMVIPSIWEGFGLIAAEAMACGIPIAASDVPGLSEVVGDAGVKFNPNDIDSIYKAIISLFKNEKYAEYIEKGKILSKKYDVDIMADRYLSVYK